ncbi:Autophagy-related protein [Wickerhamomyces ciferrii]|uniref:Autophagy-related protein 14 n=1 Tax=Wickerhamomyces ciferrii (strain ATCC 14091 / BCRC 22168 / CBS 111 / JCM 3599 / NBRC 0793 / NRRL Y-1031 F-60-10) TaxID=1206466 RepID=K0KRQ9_WICCF|nr:Autophagy-related protein [Wickerhamomyces ciferrii]CCH44033.1 Autophagy-related protein [Wickerhamomyces ciferrii]
MTRCGICHIHGGNDNGSDHQLLCSSCTNFQLLKPKLNYINLLIELDFNKKSVNQILQNCIQGENITFLKDYINDKQDKVVNDSVSIHSIAALSSQLLTIDSKLIQRKNNKILREINILKSKSDSKKLRLESLNLEKHEKLQKIASKSLNYNKDQITSKINQILDDSLKFQKQINNNQSILFQELINIYNIKKRKTSNQLIFLISFNPIISIYNLTQYPLELINSSLLQITKFIYQISQIWFINLPYDIKIMTKEDQFNPKIQNFEILPKLADSNTSSIFDISKNDLIWFINSLSRLILNIMEILKFFQLDEKIHNYKTLFKIDELIYKIVNNNHEITSNDSNDFKPGEIDLYELNQLIYKYLINKIKEKNNEWQVIKNDIFDDDE